MFITVDILQKRGACQEYLDFFVKHYPDGVEMLYMIERGHMPYHALHWGYKWLDPNEEEVAAYWKRVAVENSQGIDESDHITNSEIISHSSRVDNSHNIYDSEDITSCEYIVKSSFVDNSDNIYSSNFVDNSYKVLGSQNITNSNQVVDSSYVVNCHGIYECENVVNSHTIWRSKKLTNCGFCFDCQNISNALFCTQQTEGEYLLFNKKIDKIRFDMVYKQYQRYASIWLNLAESWPITNDYPKKLYDYRKHVKDIPPSFYAWAKTLPGYDPITMYSMTFDPQFLT
jgi:hypothetical protein